VEQPAGRGEHAVGGGNPRECQRRAEELEAAGSYLEAANAYRLAADGYRKQCPLPETSAAFDARGRSAWCMVQAIACHVSELDPDVGPLIVKELHDLVSDCMAWAGPLGTGDVILAHHKLSRQTYEIARLLDGAGMENEAAEAQFLSLHHLRVCRARLPKKAVADRLWCLKAWLLEWSCGYGLRWRRWLYRVLLTVVLFGLLYMPTPGFLSDLLPQGLSIQMSAEDLPRRWDAAGLLDGLVLSAMTFATFGFGARLPTNLFGRLVVCCEVCVGYVMFGLLVGMLAASMTRRTYVPVVAVARRERGGFDRDALPSGSPKVSKQCQRRDRDAPSRPASAVWGLLADLLHALLFRRPQRP